MAKSDRPTARVTLKERAKQRERQQLSLIGAVVVAVIAFAAVVIVLVRQANTSTTAGAYSLLRQETTADGAPILGDPTSAKVTIVEFADFSCPHCLEYHPVITQIIDKYVRTGQARLMYRPETFVGQEYNDMPYNPSVMGGEAALCAGKQNGFWDMEDAIYNIQSQLTPRGLTIDRLRETAKSLNLDSDKLVQCMLSHDTASVLDKSAQFGSTLGVNSTPSLLYSTDGNQTFHWFKVLDPQTNTEREQQGGGVPLAEVDRVIAAAYKPQG